jgi:hypothetical protein
MTQHSRQTAPTQFVPAAGVRFAYRRFGKSGGVPLVFNQHFTGTMDHWDPAVTDGLPGIAKILFNNAGRLQQLWRGADLVRGNERRRRKSMSAAFRDAHSDSDATGPLSHQFR